MRSGRGLVCLAALMFTLTAAGVSAASEAANSTAVISTAVKSTAVKITAGKITAGKITAGKAAPAKATAAKPAAAKTQPAKTASAKPAAKPRAVVKPILPSPEKDAAIVVDGATGTVLYARNPDAIRYPASLTKMMTLYLLFEALDKGTIKLDTPLTASAHAAEQSPTKLSVPAGGSIPVQTAIEALAVLSANDVAVVIAEALGGGSEATFAAMMTGKARQLGMRSTTFHNASGLPHAQQLTTARDMAILGRHLAYDFPQYYRYFNTASFTYKGRTYGTHNNVTRAFDGADGIKTGYTYLSGFNLVTSAVRDNKHVVGVVMGGPTAAIRDREMMRLLSAAFEVGKQNPVLLADANVPWKGGKGPGGDLFKANPGESNLMLAFLDMLRMPKTAKPATLLAQAKSGTAPSEVVVPGFKPALRGSQVMLASMLTPILKPGVPAKNPLQLVSVSVKPQPLRLGLSPMLRAPNVTGEIAQGDSSDAPPTVVATAAAKLDEPEAATAWTVQIGAFANETLARTELANFAKRGDGLLGKAEKLVVPFSAADGKKLYRARFGNFAETDARNICRRMSERGQTCFAVPQAA